MRGAPNRRFRAVCAARSSPAADQVRSDASAELDRLPAVVEEVRFATDSPLEGERFEPSVPREISNAFESAPAMQAAAIRPVELGHRLRCRTALMLKPTPTGMGEGARSR